MAGLQRRTSFYSHDEMLAGVGFQMRSNYNPAMKGFYQRVYEIVERIPRGRVATYGQIARALGQPRGARMVGWAMRTCPEELPWHRVLNGEGKSSLPSPGRELQRALLADEGVRFDQSGRVDLAQYSWDIERENADRIA